MRGLGFKGIVGERQGDEVVDEGEGRVALLRVDDDRLTTQPLAAAW